MGWMEGTLLLLRRAQGIEHASDEEVNQAGNIVIALDHFPLALDQAGAYIEETQCSFEDYLNLYQTHRQELLAWRGRQAIDYPHSVVTSWSLSFQKVQSANPAAAELLHLCSFLAPNRIPEELIKDGVAHWPSSLQQAVSDPFASDQMIKEVLKFSLMKRLVEDHMLSIHPLMQAVQIERMDQEEQRQWARRVVFAVNERFPRDVEDVSTWPQCLRYLEQAQACHTLVERYTLSLIEGADLLNRTGLYLYKHGLYTAAESLYQRALAIYEQQLGAMHPLTASSLNNLAMLYRDQGKYEQVEQLHERALAIRMNRLPIDPITTAILAAISAGNRSGLSEMNTVALADAYQALKELLSKKLGAGSRVMLAMADLETKPESADRRVSLAEEMTAAQAAQDSEIMAAARYLLTLMQSQQAGSGKYTVQISGSVQGQVIGDHNVVTQHFDDLGEQAATLRQLGNSAYSQRDYEQARGFYQQSLNIWEQLGDQSEAASIQHQLDTLDLLTQQRYANISIVRQEDRKIIPKTTSLGTSKMYALRLNIGPLLNESVVQDAEQYPFPVNLLPPTNVGYWLEVIVVSDDFVVPLRHHHLFLPTSGSSWVCNCPPGEDHQCTENERQPYLFISIQTPEQPGVAQLRIAIYYQKNLIQSQLLTARIAAMV